MQLSTILTTFFSVVPNMKPTPVCDDRLLTTYFSEDQDRLHHIRGVVQLSGGTTEAYLHDIGYAKSLQRTGFHPVDSALFALEHGFDESVIKAVLFHSGAEGEADLRGGKLRALYQQLSPLLTPEDRERIDFLSYCDIHTSPQGKRVSLEERLSGVFSRYGVESIVYQNMKNWTPYFYRLEKKYLKRQEY